MVSLTTELEQARSEIGSLMQKLQKQSSKSASPPVDTQLQDQLRMLQSEKDSLTQKVLDMEETISQQKDEIETLKFESEEKKIVEQELVEIKQAKERVEDTVREKRLR